MKKWDQVVDIWEVVGGGGIGLLFKAFLLDTA